MFWIFVCRSESQDINLIIFHVEKSKLVTEVSRSAVTNLPNYDSKTKKNNNSCSFIKVSTILFRILHTGIIFKNMYLFNDRSFENCGFSLFLVINIKVK